MKQYWVQFGLKAQDQTKGVFARVNNALVKMKKNAADSLFSRAQAMPSMIESLGNGLPAIMSVSGGLSTVGLAAAGAGVAVTRMAIHDFGALDLTFRKVQAVAPEIAGSMDELREATAALSDKSRFRQGEIAEGYLELAKAGFAAQQILSAMPGVAALAGAAEIDLGEATELAAGTLRGFGMEASMMAKVADVLAMAASASAADIPDIGLALSYITPIAKQGNQTLEEMGAVVALLANNMVKGEKAGTGVRGMITKLAAPSKAAAKELSKLGVRITDNNGKMRPLLDITNDLRDATAGMTDAQRLATMETLVGLEGITALGVLMNQTGSSIDTTRDKMRKAGGEAQRMSDEHLKGISAAADEVGKSFNSLAVDLGELVSPAVIEGLKVLKASIDAVRWSLQLVDDTPGQVRVDYDPKKLHPDIAKPIPGMPLAPEYGGRPSSNSVLPPTPPQNTKVDLTIKVKGENGAKGTVAGVQTQGHPVNVSVLGYMGS